MPRYTNAWKNIRFDFEAVETPRSTEEIPELVGRARDRGLRLKPAGGRHSFNNSVRTRDVLVDLRHLDRVGPVDRDRGTATLEAGTTLARAIVALDAEGLHFPSLGSYSAQSIAGAIATSTHGSSLRHGCLSDIVLGLEAVTADGRVVRLSGDDPLLRALRAGLGQLAIVTRVEIACVPAFWLTCSVTPLPEEEGFATAVRRAREAEYLNMLWLPYTGRTVVRTLTRVEASTRNATAAGQADAALRRNRLTNTAVDLAHFFAGHAFLRLPRLLGRRYSGLIRDDYLADEGCVDKSYNLFRYDKYHEPTSNHYLRLIFNTEHALDVASLEPALREVRDVLRAYASKGRYINYPRIHVRFCPRSDRTLVGLNAGRDTAYVGLYIVASIRHRPQIEVAEAVERVLIAHGGRPHWGKYRYARSDLYKQTYAGWPEFVRLRAELDPLGVFSDGAEPFLDLDRLERPPVGRMLASLFARDTYSKVEVL
jgi:FAD/FMN-containing dehydrogenase